MKDVEIRDTNTHIYIHVHVYITVKFSKKQILSREGQRYN